MNVTIHKGVRYRLARTSPSRFGPGNVHVLYYSREAKEWRIWCTDDPEYSWHLADEDDLSTPVTCQRCNKASVVEQ